MNQIIKLKLIKFRFLLLFCATHSQAPIETTSKTFEIANLSYRLCTDSILRIARKKEIRSRVIKIIQEILYIIFIALLLLSPSIAIGFIYSTKLKKYKFFSIDIFVSIILIISRAIAVYIGSKKTINATMCISMISIIYLFRIVSIHLCFKFRRTKYFAMTSLLLANVLSFLLFIQYFILLLAELAEINGTQFINEIKHVSHIIPITAFVWLVILIRVNEPQIRYILSRIISIMFILAFSMYFIQLNLERAFWLIFTYFAMEWIRNWSLLFLYNIIKFLPRYTNAVNEREKMGFIKLLIFFRGISAIMLVPLTASFYLSFFKISLWLILQSIIGRQVLQSLFIVGINVYMFIITILLNQYLCGYFARMTNYKDSASAERAIKAATIITNIISLLLSLIFIFVLPYTLGSNISNVFTIVGLLFSALSFATREFIQDLIQGILALYEGTLKPGDLIELDGKIAKIECIFLRYIQARYDDGVVIFVPFRNINVVKNKSRVFTQLIFEISFNIATEYETGLDVINTAFDKLRQKDEERYITTDLNIRGINRITQGFYTIQMAIQTSAGADQIVRRAFNITLLETITSKKITLGGIVQMQLLGHDKPVEF